MTPRLIDPPQWFPPTPARPVVGVDLIATLTASGDVWTASVTNRHPTLEAPWLAFDLGSLSWTPTDYGTVEAFPAQWMRDQWTIAHPSTRQPRGVWPMTAPGLGWCLTPIGEDRTQKIVVRWANVPTTSLMYFIRRTVRPGETITTQFSIREAPAGNPAGLLDSYRQAHFDTMQYRYVTTFEPAVACFNFTSTATPANPYGWRDSNHDMNGPTASAWALDQVRICRDLGCESLTLWNPPGIAPYSNLNADFCPPRIVPALASICAAAGGMRVGIGARMGIVNDPAAPAGSAGPGQPAGIRARREDEIPALVADIDRAISAGVDYFYFDEGGMRPNDTAIAALARERLWKAKRIGAGFGERTAIDVMMADIGGYTNLYPDLAGNWTRFGPSITAANIADARWYQPGYPFVVQVRDATAATTDAQIEAAYRTIIRAGARPLIPWWDARKWVPVYRRILAEVRQG